MKPKKSIQGLKINQKNYEKVERIVSYLQVFNCFYDAAMQNKELQDRPQQQQEEAHLGLPID